MTETTDIIFSFNLGGNSTVYNYKSKKILFFETSHVHMYSMDSKRFLESHVVHDPFEYDRLIEFKGHVCLIDHEGDTLSLYIFNETEYCWDLYLEEEVKLNISTLIACSSSTDLAIILETVTEGGHLAMDYVYFVDFDSKSLNYFSSSIHVMDQYLFVPDYISL